MAGAAPTVGDVDGQLVKAVHLLETIKEGASVNSDNWLDLKDDLTQDLHTEYAKEVLDGVQALEGSLASILANPRALLDPIMLSYGRAIGKPGADPELLARELIPRHFIDNSKNIEKRVIAYPGISMTGGNTGDGIIRALTVDHNNQVIESVYAESLTAEVILDATAPGGHRNREVFLVEGQPKWPNELQRVGSGIREELTCIDARRGGAQAIITNGGFDSITEDGGFVIDVPGWTSDVDYIGDGTDFEKDTTNTYQPANLPDEVRAALNIKLSRTLTQRLDARSVRLARELPIGGQIAFNAQVGTAVGSLTISLGALTATVSVTGLTGWQLLAMPLTDKAWPRNLYADPLEASVQFTRTSGELLIDDFVLAPFENIGGHWLQAIGGATAFQERDTASWSVTKTTGAGVIQEWIWRAYEVHWPHDVSASAGLADPT